MRRHDVLSHAKSMELSQLAQWFPLTELEKDGVDNGQIVPNSRDGFLHEIETANEQTIDHYYINKLPIEPSKKVFFTCNTCPIRLIVFKITFSYFHLQVH